MVADATRVGNGGRCGRVRAATEKWKRSPPEWAKKHMVCVSRSRRTRPRYACPHRCSRTSTKRNRAAKGQKQTRQKRVLKQVHCCGSQKRGREFLVLDEKEVVRESRWDNSRPGQLN